MTNNSVNDPEATTTTARPVTSIPPTSENLDNSGWDLQNFCHFCYCSDHKPRHTP